MKKFYLIDAVTSLAVWVGDESPVLHESHVDCADTRFLCYTQNNSFVSNAEEVAEFVQHKFRLVGQNLIVDPAWVAPVVPPQPVVVPKTVTMRQARIALLQTGKLAAVNAAIAGMAGAAGDAARIEWEFSSEVQRDKPLVLALTPALGITPAQLDQLFILAATL